MSTVIAGGALGAALHNQEQYWGALRESALPVIARRDVEASRRIGEERVRIAGDLHDLIGHQIAVASMHLGAVEVSVADDPSTAARSAAEARAALRTVTSETQHILKLLRSDGATDVDREVAGLATVPELIDSFRLLGMKIDARLDSPPAPIAPGVEVAVYRVVQEALTNAHRYGTGAASVQVQTDHERLEVNVANTVGTSRPPVKMSGYGLVGMRERVTAAGGRLAVADHDGTFEVRATMPLDRRTVDDNHPAR